MNRRPRRSAAFLLGLLLLAGAPAPPGGAQPKPKDAPPTVEFKTESTRNPDPNEFDGQGDPKDYEWDLSVVAAEGRVVVIYHAKSETGIRAVNLRYRVVAKGVKADDYPKEYRKIAHPQDDPNLLVFARLPLKPFTGDPEKLKLGKFVPDLGLFEQSFRDVKRFDRINVGVEFYRFPGGKEAGGRYALQVATLEKTLPDGKGGVKKTKLEVGDAVELYVEVFDNGLGADGKPDPNRPPGYTTGAKRKDVATPEDVIRAIRARDEARKKP